MANTYKILAQSFPLLATLTTLYTVPALTSAIVSTLCIANQSATVADKVRVSVAIAGAADEAKQYVFYDLTLAANNSFAATFGITLATTDVVRVYSANGTTSFILFGQEIT